MSAIRNAHHRIAVRSKAPKDSGFSLLEVLVVLVIFGAVVGAVSGTIALRNNPLTPFDYARLAQLKLYEARSNAIVSGTASRIWIDLKKNEIDYSQGKPLLVSDSVDLRIVTAEKLISADGRAQLIFLPDGSSSGIEIHFSLADGRSDDKDAHLTVNWLTGLAEIHRPFR